MDRKNIISGVRPNIGDSSLVTTPSESLAPEITPGSLPSRFRAESVELLTYLPEYAPQRRRRRVFGVVVLGTGLGLGVGLFCGAWYGGSFTNPARESSSVPTPSMPASASSCVGELLKSVAPMMSAEPKASAAPLTSASTNPGHVRTHAHPSSHAVVAPEVHEELPPDTTSIHGVEY